MTNEETFASLAVNSWVNGGRVVWPKANLRECDLSECDLTGADLSGAYLFGARITLGNRTFTLHEETAR